MNRALIPVALLLVVATAACENGSAHGAPDARSSEAPTEVAHESGTSAAPAERTAADDERPATVVDSALPMDVAMARFRKGLENPRTLKTGVGSRDALVRDVVDALASRDTMAFEDLAVDRAAWAWLYYPTSKTAHPPYELPPGLAWFQLQEANRKGVLRALRRLGGHELELSGYSCAPKPTVEDDNRIWIGCELELAIDGKDPVPVRLFSSILERDGRFAVLSYQNDY